MPSTRGGGRTDIGERELDSDDCDPDYVEEWSSDEEEPPTRATDRAQWVVDNVAAVEELYLVFKNVGEQQFGRAFFQCGDVTKFAHFIYNNTTPLSESQ